ncbi:sigma-54-dependent Fis family transcriptional regulator [Polymorphobacter arshaanensis]|uniref:Sigma-54-dependent Fis family transcriptional regulator n=1 Tax=Glacieibacterium arshaanense TaxID=2511025 RepID=A0A4Y9EPH4_9SPHN|nr:sigma-54 dependent transcriptional regulator [Polymorphobacter arshaanensis]TFU05516.1 sigma-54-dependent Fis family transcriptional regulator [Polymorphobacter arshaanensis]
MTPTVAARILVVEDVASLAMTYAAHLEGIGHTVDIADSGAAARQLIDSATEPYDVVLLDLQLPDCDGLDWLAGQPELAEKSSIIVITSDGSIKRAIAAMRLGTYDFLVKPLAAERLLTTVRNAAEHHVLAEEVKVVRSLTTRDNFQGFIGRSSAMQAVYRAVESVADSKATVFITGESGSGKEVAAEAIHRASRRHERPFVAINCGAIPENLLESELFGHIKGAFTGAIDNRLGAAKEADGGTLFLDEICEMELKLQVKLLRFLQTGMIQRVGSSKPEPVDVRVICATNRDPTAEVAAGRFREDLFYRLAVIPLEMPPLRERGSDVIQLAQAFLERFAREEHKHFDPLSVDDQAKLGAYNWPGNVRELQNVIRRAVVMSEGPALNLADFATAPARPALAAEGASFGMANPSTYAPPGIEGLSGLTLDAIERLVIEHVIDANNGSLPAAARSLGISPSTLYRKRERWSGIAA